MNIIYKKDGIMVGDNFIWLSDIINKCNQEKIKEERLHLLRMGWKGWRGFDDGILEEIVLPLDSIEIIKKYILGKIINFGEIAGKHSEVYNTLDNNDITIIDDPKIINSFLKSNPSGHAYNHSFLYTFIDKARDGVYDDITEEDIKKFRNTIP